MKLLEGFLAKFMTSILAIRGINADLEGSDIEISEIGLTLKAFFYKFRLND